MKKDALKKFKQGDYILVLSAANISFAGYIESIEKDDNGEYLVFQPSAESPLWIKIRSDFIKDLTLLIEKGKVIADPVPDFKENSNKMMEKLS